MKLNAASEMLPLSNAAWMNLHPLVPEDSCGIPGFDSQSLGTVERRLQVLQAYLSNRTPGAAGEYTGLRVIRSYQESIGQG